MVEEFKLLAMALDVEDDDRSEDSWKTYQNYITRLVDAVQEAMDVKSSTLLIIDEMCLSSPAAVFCTFMLLKKQVRIEHAVSMCTGARPAVSMSMSLRRGLELMQRALDEKKLKRLRAKVRNSTSGSIAF